MKYSYKEVSGDSLKRIVWGDNENVRPPAGMSADRTAFDSAANLFGQTITEAPVHPTGGPPVVTKQATDHDDDYDEETKPPARAAKDFWDDIDRRLTALEQTPAPAAPERPSHRVTNKHTVATKNSEITIPMIKRGLKPYQILRF